MAAHTISPEGGRLVAEGGGAHGERFLTSALTEQGRFLSTDDFLEWFAELRQSVAFDVKEIPFTSLRSWGFEPDTGNLVHESGRFFSIQGVDLRDANTGEQRSQPIINQPETGILGILAKEFDGVLHFLMQAKPEPGNADKLQLSPTMQATHSNYTGVHRGSTVPYAEYFLGPERERVLVDTLQSEHGDWFWFKHNRNLIVETTREVPVRESFQWLTLGQILRLLSTDNVVNMDTRSVLACAPLGPWRDSGDGFGAALARSSQPPDPAGCPSGGLGTWLIEAKARHRSERRLTGLAEVRTWRRSPERIARADGGRFDVLAVSVTAGTREVTNWTQPLIEPCAQGLVAFLVKRIDGVLHILFRAGAEPGLRDSVEIAPTLQCVPSDPAETERLPFYGTVTEAGRGDIRFQALLSEEGGRFLNAMSDYRIVEVGPEFPEQVPADYHWATLGELTDLLRHDQYLSIQTRTLVLCLRSLLGDSS